MTSRAPTWTIVLALTSMGACHETPPPAQSPPATASSTTAPPPPTASASASTKPVVACSLRAPATGVVAFSPDGTLLAIGARIDADETAESKMIDIWDLKTGTVIKTLDAGLPNVARLSFSPDGRYLVSAANPHTAEGDVRLWDTKTWTMISSHPTYCFEEIVWGRDSYWFAAAGCHMALSVTRIAGKSWDRPFSAKDNDGAAAQSTPISVSKDGKRLAYLVQDGRFESWDVTKATPTLLMAMKTASWSAYEFNADGTYVAIAVRAEDPSVSTSMPYASTIDVHDLRSGLRVRRVRAKAIAEVPTVLRWAANGDVVAQHAGGKVLVWSAKPEPGAGFLTVLPVTAANASEIAVSDDGARLAVIESDGALSLWDLATAKRTKTLHPAVPGDARSSLHFQLGGMLVETADDGAVDLWDVGSGVKRWRVPAIAGSTSREVVVSRSDGKLAALGGVRARLVRPSDGAALTLQTFVGGGKRVSLAYATDGSYFGATEAVACVPGLDAAKARPTLVPDFIAAAK